MKKYVLLLMLLAMARGAAAAVPGRPFSSTSQLAKTAYAESEAGWKSQMRTILDAYRSGESEREKQLLEQFRIPAATEYFGQHLGAEKKDEYSERYSRLFDTFASSLDGTLQDIAQNRGADLVVKFLESRGETPPQTGSPRESGVFTIRPIRSDFCHFQITLNGKPLASWADTMVYIDGAFRFIGFGAYPFWVWRNGGEGTAPKGGGFPHPVAILSRMEPHYPEEAKKKGIQGDVVLKLLIDRQGQIKRITTVSGDPSLVDAANEAVHLWRFTPGRMGALPLEMETIVTVEFRLK